LTAAREGWVFRARENVAAQNKRERRGGVRPYLRSISELFLDNLVPGNAGVWTVEVNEHKENPLGNNFESLGHLLSNITGLQCDVEVDQQANVRTAWMGALPAPVVAVRRSAI